MKFKIGDKIRFNKTNSFYPESVEDKFTVLVLDAWYDGNNVYFYELAVIESRGLHFESVIFRPFGYTWYTPTTRIDDIYDLVEDEEEIV